MGEPSTIRSLSRGLKLLDILAQHPSGVTAKWLSATSNIPLSTCYHLVRTLLNEGYIEKDKTTQLYKMSYKIAYLYNHLPIGRTIPEAIKLISQDIVKHIGETTYIARWEHDQVIIQHIVESNQAVKVRTLYVGYREHAFMHALGKSILAHVPDRTLHRYTREHPPAPCTPSSPQTFDDTIAELQVTRNQGYSRDEEEWQQGVCCIGAPIFQHDGTIWGAVAISMPHSRYDPSDLTVVDYILDQAQAMSTYLGYAAKDGHRIVEHQLTSMTPT